MKPLADDNTQTEQEPYPDKTEISYVDETECLSSNDPTTILNNLDNKSLIQGFILSVILGSPKAKMRRGNTKWSSRF